MKYLEAMENWRVKTNNRVTFIDYKAAGIENHLLIGLGLRNVMIFKVDNTIGVNTKGKVNKHGSGYIGGNVLRFKDTLLA